jgi:hypothetical protein
MIQNLLQTIHPLPLPVFGSVKTASMFLCAKSKTLPRMVGWIGPVSVGALWFVWPAVDEEWKVQMGIKNEIQKL